MLCDPTSIHQIMMNLCTNAFHAMEEQDGVLEVSLEEIEVDEERIDRAKLMPSNYLHLTVADSGAGMIRDILPRIFEPYFTTKRKGAGIRAVITKPVVRCELASLIRTVLDQGPALRQ